MIAFSQACLEAQLLIDLMIVISKPHQIFFCYLPYFILGQPHIHIHNVIIIQFL